MFIVTAPHVSVTLPLYCLIRRWPGQAPVGRYADVVLAFPSHSAKSTYPGQPDVPYRGAMTSAMPAPADPYIPERNPLAFSASVHAWMKVTTSALQPELVVSQASMSK